MTLTPFRSQKSVVCDEPSKSGGQSTLVAYLGGIDLTDGRYFSSAKIGRSGDEIESKFESMTCDLRNEPQNEHIWM